MLGCSGIGPPLQTTPNFEDFPNDIIIMNVSGDVDGTIAAIRQYLSSKFISSTIIFKDTKYVITSFVSDIYRPHE
jgi:hypothetical protein